MAPAHPAGGARDRPRHRVERAVRHEPAAGPGRGRLPGRRRGVPVPALLVARGRGAVLPRVAGDGRGSGALRAVGHLVLRPGAPPATGHPDPRPRRRHGRPGARLLRVGSTADRQQPAAGVLRAVEPGLGAGGRGAARDGRPRPGRPACPGARRRGRTRPAHGPRRSRAAGRGHAVPRDGGPAPRAGDRRGRGGGHGRGVAGRHGARRRPAADPRSPVLRLVPVALARPGARPARPGRRSRPRRPAAPVPARPGAGLAHVRDGRGPGPSSRPARRPPVAIARHRCAVRRPRGGHRRPDRRAGARGPRHGRRGRPHRHHRGAGGRGRPGRGRGPAGGGPGRGAAGRAHQPRPGPGGRPGRRGPRPQRRRHLVHGGRGARGHLA